MFIAERSESKIRVLGKLSTVFQCLRQLGEAREQLTMFRYIQKTKVHFAPPPPTPTKPRSCIKYLIILLYNVIEFYLCRHTLHTDDHSPLPYRPLLSQLMDAIFSPSHPDLSDLDYHPQGTTATNIIKSGFRFVGWFRNGSRR